MILCKLGRWAASLRALYAQVTVGLLFSVQSNKDIETTVENLTSWTVFNVLYCE